MLKVSSQYTKLLCNVYITRVRFFRAQIPPPATPFFPEFDAKSTVNELKQNSELEVYILISCACCTKLTEKASTLNFKDEVITDL